MRNKKSLWPHQVCLFFCSNLTEGTYTKQIVLIQKAPEKCINKDSEDVVTAA